MDKPRRTAAERQELGKLVRLVRLRARVAKQDAEARGQRLLAEAEAKLAACYRREDEAWADITAEANRMAQEADARLAARCRARGIPESFRPSLRPLWLGRGADALKERRAELRQALQAQVAAQVQEAQVAIEREAERQLTPLAAGALLSAEALAHLGNMPSPEALLPRIDTAALPGSPGLQLEGPPTVTERNGTVTFRYGCALCGKPLPSGRGLYCSGACRQKAYRLRRL